MIHIQEATYTLRSDGGEMRATAHVGSQDITTNWPITDGDGNLPLLLAQMMPTIQDVTFRTTTDGSEITITLAIGDRGYECRLPIQKGDEELKQALERLLREIDRKLADTLQSYLRDMSPPERDVAG